MGYTGLRGVGCSFRDTSLKQFSCFMVFFSLLLGVFLAVSGVGISAAGAQEPFLTGFTPPVPAQYVIEDAQTSGRVENGVALLDITARVRIFRSEWTQAPLLTGDFSITNASITSKDHNSAFLKREGNVYSLYARSKSSVDIKLTVACKVMDMEGQKRVTLPLLEALAASTSLELAAQNVKFSTIPQADASLEELENGHSRINIFGSPGKSVQLFWSPQPRLGDLPALMFADHASSVEVSRGALRVGSNFTFRVLQGTVKTLKLNMPEGANLLNVNGEGISQWNVEKEGKSATLTVELAEKIRDNYTLGIITETAIEKLPATMVLPMASALDVQREKGTISINAQKGIKVEPGDCKNVTQVDVAEISTAAPASAYNLGWQGNSNGVLNQPASQSNMRRRVNLPDQRAVNAETNQITDELNQLRTEMPQMQQQIAQQQMLMPLVPHIPQADLAFRFLSRPVIVQLKVSEVSPKVTASVNTLCSISRENVRSLSTINYAIREAGVFHFNIKMPEGLKLMDVKGQNLNTWQMDKNQLGIDLRIKAEGSYTLFLETEQQVEEGKPLDLLTPELVGVERETGYIAIASRAGTKVELSGNPSGGAVQVDSAELPTTLRPSGKSVELGFRYIKHPFGITLSIGAVEAEVYATTASMLVIDERELQLLSNIELDVRKSGIFELRLNFPKGWRLSDDPQGKIIEDWRLDAQTNVLTMTFNGRVTGKSLIGLRAEKSIDSPEKEQTFPVFSIIDAKKETGFLAVSTGMAMRMSAAPGSYRGLNPIPPAELTSLMPTVRNTTTALAFKYLKSGWDLKVSLEEIKPLVTAQIVSMADISSTLVSSTARINYEIKQAGVDTFYVQFPQGARSPDISGNNIKTRSKVEDLSKDIAEAAAADKQMGEVWKVVLQDKVKGGYMLNLTFEQLVNKNDKNVVYAGARALGVEREEGYVGLAASANVEVLPGADSVQGAAYRIDVRQIPGLDQLRPQNPVIWAFQYNSRPYLLDIKVTKHEDVPVVTAVADMAWFETVIGRDGQSTTDLFLSMRNNSQQYLHLLLPEGSRIWEAKVNGLLVSPSREKTANGQARTLIPIAEASRGGKPFQVTIRYEQSLGRLGQWSGLALNAPVMSIPILRCVWDVYLPEEYGVVNLGGDMSESMIDEQYGILRFYRDNRRKIEASARVMQEKNARSNKTQGVSARGLDTGASATSGKVIHRYEKTMALNESQGKTSPAELRLTLMRDAFDNVSMVLLGLVALAGVVLLWKLPVHLRLAYFGGAVLVMYMVDTLAGDFYPGQVLAVFVIAAVGFVATVVVWCVRMLQQKALAVRESMNNRKMKQQSVNGKLRYSKDKGTYTFGDQEKPLAEKEQDEGGSSGQADAQGDGEKGNTGSDENDK